MNEPLFLTKMSLARAAVSAFAVGSLPYLARMYALMAWREEPVRSLRLRMASRHMSAVVGMVAVGGWRPASGRAQSSRASCRTARPTGTEVGRPASG